MHDNAKTQVSRLRKLFILWTMTLLPAAVLEFFFMTYELLLFFNTTAVIASLLFVIRYSFLTWEKSQTGIVTMGISVCVLLISVGGLLRNVTTVTTVIASDVVLFLAYYGVTIVMPWRLLLVNKAQRENRELRLVPIEEDENGL